MSGIDSFTKLCLHLDGTNGSLVFTDSSFSGHTISQSGTSAISTAQSVFGGASMLIPDSGGFAFGNGPSSDYAFGTGDFVIDMRYRPLSFGSTAIWDWGFNVGGQAGSCPALAQIGTSIQWYFNGSARISSAAVSANTWYHVAVVRSSGVTRLFLDGVQAGSDYTDTNNYSDDATNGIGIGFILGTGNSQPAYYDEMRISKGTDRGWFGGFTPPSAAYSVSATAAFRKTLSSVGTAIGKRQKQDS